MAINGCHASCQVEQKTNQSVLYLHVEVMIMLVLLFLLLAAAMLLISLTNRRLTVITLYIVVLVLGALWFFYHMTERLPINL